MNSLLEQAPAFAQIGRRFRLEDELNFLRESSTLANLQRHAPCGGCDPMVLIATGNSETLPSTIGCSKSSALPPPGDFISRSAHSR